MRLSLAEPGTYPLRAFVGPGRVLAGAGASCGVGAELMTVGARSDNGCILLVADETVLELGLADAVTASLKDSGFDVAVAPGIAGEPTRSIVDSCLALDVRPAAVVGVGGGSAMDVAKLVSVALDNDIDLSRGFPPGLGLAPRKPLGLVATTAGTGAEATAVAMLWQDEAKLIFAHPYLVPDVAVLDPDLLRQLPSPVIGAGGMDAVSHAVESLLSTFRTPLTTAAAGEALKGLARSLPEAYADRTTQSLTEILISAFQAGLALNASVCLGHSLAYTIAARTGLPHGVTCAMALPYCLAYCHPGADRQMAAIAGLVGMRPEPDNLLRWLVQLNKQMKIPGSLAEVGISADQLPLMASECVDAYPRPNNPVPVETGRVEALLVRFLRGDLESAWRELPVSAAMQERA